MAGLNQYVWLKGTMISNKCFIHCPAADKAEIIIFWFELQDERKRKII